jgi:hypothetical protein
MNWNESELQKLPQKQGVRQRGLEMNRLATFTDAAFAFATTMLVYVHPLKLMFSALFARLLPPQAGCICGLRLYHPGDYPASARVAIR